MAELRFRDDAPHHGPILSLTAFLAGSNATAVRIEPEEDVRTLLPRLDRLTLVEITFPKFRDGRGYSSARILREAGYTGELRATGDVLVDQIVSMRRCGFDSFTPDAPIDTATLEATLAREGYAYQVSPTPIWKLRHD